MRVSQELTWLKIIRDKAENLNARPVTPAGDDVAAHYEVSIEAMHELYDALADISAAEHS